jgi:hypothetical protein
LFVVDRIYVKASVAALAPRRKGIRQMYHFDHIAAYYLHKLIMADALDWPHSRIRSSLYTYQNKAM